MGEINSGFTHSPFQEDKPCVVCRVNKIILKHYVCPDCYVDKEIESGLWMLAVEHARRANREACRKHRIWQPGDFNVTPQEELFMKLFNAEKQRIADMDDGQLAEARAEFSRIAFEARARLSAQDDEIEGRRKKRGQKITRSVEADETSSNAINQITKRAGRLSKQDKMMESLIAMGVAREEAIKIIGARNFNGDRADGNTKPATTKKPAVPVPSINITPSEPPKPFVNPFAKPKENTDDASKEKGPGEA